MNNAVMYQKANHNITAKIFLSMNLCFKWFKVTLYVYTVAVDADRVSIEAMVNDIAGQ